MKGKERQKTVEFMLKSLLAIELWRGNLSQDEIAKRLGISKSDVSAVLKGVSRKLFLEETSPEEK